MKPFRATFDGQTFRPISGWDELKTLPVGGQAMILSVELPRSPQHHARTFALINAAFENWPEHHDFTPECADHLRAWLATKAGDHFRECRIFPVPATAAPKAIAAFSSLVITEMSRHKFCFLRTGAKSVAVYWPKSMAWSKMGQREFSPLAQAIAKIIVAETGISEAALLPEREKETAQQ